MEKKWIFFGVIVLAGIAAIIEQIQTKTFGVYMGIFAALIIISLIFLYLENKNARKQTEPPKASGEGNKQEVPDIQQKKDN